MPYRSKGLALEVEERGTSNTGVVWERIRLQNTWVEEYNTLGKHELDVAHGLDVAHEQDENALNGQVHGPADWRQEQVETRLVNSPDTEVE